jgi:hypothetical protein
LFEKEFALNTSRLKKPYADPWKSFPPLRIDMLTTPPAVRPYCASNILLITLISSSASAAGTNATLLPSVRSVLLGAPSRTNSTCLVRLPLIDQLDSPSSEWTGWFESDPAVNTAPGVNTAMVSGLRDPCSGSSVMVLLLRTRPRSPFSASSSGASLVTVIRSATSPICSVTSITEAMLVFNWMFSRVKLRNPVLCTESRYIPGLTKRNRYCPASLVRTAVTTPVWLLVSVTSVPGTTSPAGSATVPLRVERLSWA